MSSADSLRGKVALVTGATRSVGIGAAIARQLASAGAEIFLHYYRAYDQSQPYGIEPDEPEAIVSELRTRTSRVESLELDLAQPTAPALLIGRAVECFGSLDILINHAAHSESGGIDSIDAAQLDRHYQVNLRAPFLLSAEFARHHRAGRSGRIIHVTSGQGLGGMPSELAYAATKGGLDALTVSLPSALAGRGVTVNAVDPGPTDTGWMSAEVKEALEREAPFGRVGVPEDAARVVAFLAFDEAAWITGQIIRARGGFRG